jgi:hypothetical protein
MKLGGNDMSITAQIKRLKEDGKVLVPHEQVEGILKRVKKPVFVNQASNLRTWIELDIQE